MTRSSDPGEPPFADARAFLDAGASRLGRCLVLAIACLLLAAGLWSGLAEVDEVVRAPGRAEPVGQSKLVNHPQGGKIVELGVIEGQRVEAGQVLLRLDSSVAQKELDELEGRLELRTLEAARLASEADATPLRLAPDSELRRPELLEAQLRLKQARADALASRRDVLRRAWDGRRSEAASASADQARYGEGLAHLDRQLTAIRELSQRGLYPKLKLIAAEKEVADARGDQRRAAAQRAAAEAALNEAKSRLDAMERDWRREVLDELATASAERDRLREQVAAQRAFVAGLTITAPVAGIVLDLRAAAPGQSVAAFEPILTIVPAGARLEIAARVRNEDIGRIHPGMPARIKIRAYDYLRHGALAGSVTRLAADATPEPDGTLAYTVVLTAERQQLGTAAGDRALVPGMMVDVELMAGRRTVLSYLTDRLWRATDRAFTEG